MFHGLCFPSGLFIRKPSAVFGVGTHRANQHGSSSGEKAAFGDDTVPVVCWTRPHGHSRLRDHTEPPASASAGAPRLPSARISLLIALSTEAPLSRAEDHVGAAYMLFLKDKRQGSRSCP